MIDTSIKVNYPYKKFPPKREKPVLDMAKREEMIRQAVEKIQPKQDNWSYQ